MIRILWAFVFALASGLVPAAAQDGGPFAPRLVINDRIITNWEVQQRTRFLQALRAPGDLEELALEGLIEDRLRLEAGDRNGLRLSEQQVQTGLEEFAGRANLTLDQFIAALAAEGVAAQTFRDFVEAGLVWREVVGTRFGPRAQITEAEIDRAVALTTQAGAARVLLSEIILRADTPQFQEESQALAQRLADQIDTPGAFAAAARRYSVSGSAGRGGRMDWIDLANLPPQIAGQILSLGEGDVTDPIPIPNAIALFQLRAVEENDVPESTEASVEFARLIFPGGAAADAERVRLKVDTCDDLYGIAQKLPEDQLLREVSAVGDLDADFALALAQLDGGETTVRTLPNGVELVRVCGRTPELGADVDRQVIRQRLRLQRLESYANGYLAELRAEAIIRTP